MSIRIIKHCRCKHRAGGQAFLPVVGRSRIRQSIKPSACDRQECLSSCRSKIRRGFTLIEALAALMLVAIVLPFVMRGVAMSAKAGSDADRQATAVMLAQTQMDEVLLGNAWQFGDASGVFDEAYGSEADRYTWELVVEDWLSTDFRELTMTVRWPSGAGERSLELKTVVYAGG